MLGNLAQFYWSEQAIEFVGNSQRCYNKTASAVVNHNKCIQQWPLLKAEILRLAAVSGNKAAFLLDIFKELEVQSPRFSDCFQLVEIVLT